MYSGITFPVSLAFIALLGLSQCQQPADSQDASESAEQAAPEKIVLSGTAFSDSSGAFRTVDHDGEKVMVSGQGGDQWLEYELDVAIAGRYRTEIIAQAGSADATVWIEDYIDNPDGRAYNITGAMPVSVKSMEASSKDGSPLNAVKRNIRVHFSQPGIQLKEFSFTLMRRHVETPEILTQEMNGSDWKLVWSDEFDGTGIPDTSKWTFDVGDWGWGNNELQYYTVARTKNARLEDGNLIIESHKNDDGNLWTSARLTTRGKVTFRYGKIEFRAKVPANRGNWAAGWTLGDNYVDELSWPYCGEIDIMESVGYEMNDETGDGKAHASVHTRAFYFKENNHYTSTLDVKNMNDEFHTYAVVWAPSGLTAYVDDQEYFSYDDRTDERTWPFFLGQNIIINLAMGGGWGGAQGMDESITSQQMVLDYVRVYDRTNR